MGIADYLRRVFADDPMKVDYTTASDLRLRELWQGSRALTPAAKLELEAEARRRGLDLSVGATTTQSAPTHAVADMRAPEGGGFDPILDDPISVRPPGAVVLRTRGRHAVLCLLPLSAASTASKAWVVQHSRSLAFEAIVAFNQESEGALDTPLIAGHLGLPADSLYLLDSTRPAGRHFDGAIPTTQGVAMPSSLKRGSLELKVIGGRPNTLLATWSEPGFPIHDRVLIGPSIRFEDVIEHQANQVIGGLVRPVQTQLVVESLYVLKQVTVLSYLEGVSSWETALADFVSVSVVGDPARSLHIVPVSEG